MVQALRNSKRYRGFVLTSIGLQKLQKSIQQLEAQTRVRQSPRAIAERVQLAEPDGIHPMTVRKLLRCQQGVDKRSICQVFAALQLLLEVGDYAHASLSGARAIVEVLEHPAKQLHSDVAGRDTASHFCGRTEEKSQLQRQILVERCRLVSVLGVAGIGKTALVQEFTAEQQEFEYVVWKSLHHAPTIAAMLTSLLHSLVERSPAPLPTSVEELITSLLKHLQQHRCLLVLDGIESILSNRPLAGYYREGYEPYRELFRSIAESPHRSCMVLTSQEKPREFRRLEGRQVQFVRLQGLSASESQQLLQQQGTFAPIQADWHRITDYYGGNPLILKMVAARVVDYFDGSISDYLSDGSPEQLLFQEIRDLLGQQFDRASEPEQIVMVHLAIIGDWVSLSDLQADLESVISRQDLLDILDSLYRRSLFQKSRASFKLSPTLATFIQNYKNVHPQK
ncbi:NACHT domain-containing protein [Phormidesmis priestleyi ULC007]|uniref:NACHT domain-containing protein n=1 Tax=Phormidesmis priestleyi ULC007 TaxID=1920490 RepID=A0A2T1D5H6_9CYAN|nr:NACHT domain-containing protein [Phormidesmis priestleyi]PSB15691.1 NACHT domain-containing protein [Phormidesmis priestleyi ULC007]PZO45959.1 MAG: NACHT domain-containing protein [Phormidesmis priestleyi]